MNREIKFRLWLPSIKKMSYPISITDWANGYEQITVSPDCVWLQYTGLKDKNDKDGYHKDIVKSGKNLFIIEWQKEEARFLLLPCGSNTGTWQHMDMLNSYEIIGNIYENPNLLK